MDLSTTYMGLKLKNPIIASASPLSEHADNVKRMEDAGAAAVVMFSVFEEQVKQEAQALDHFLHFGTESFAESLSYFPDKSEYGVASDRYCELIRKVSGMVNIPIIGSINGITNDGWIDFAKQIEQAGARGLELNMYYVPTDADLSGPQVEQMYLDVLKSVKRAVRIPVAVKLSPFFSSMAHMAHRFEDAGADALVLFNRFYQPDFDLDKMEVHTSLQLSTANEIRLPLLWISVLHGRVKCSLAGSTGVESAQEVIKYIMAGADTVMTTSALLKHGTDHLTVMLQQLTAWMEEKEYASVQQMRGAMSQQSVENPEVFKRANYIRMLKRFVNPYAM